uniref:Uncharacterized protein n=1 Tax=Eutreptiella gymnastica TaxID=73025 RepID=A0A7S4D1Z1_9EUGL
MQRRECCVERKDKRSQSVSLEDPFISNNCWDKLVRGLLRPCAMWSLWNAWDSGRDAWDNAKSGAEHRQRLVEGWVGYGAGVNVKVTVQCVGHLRTPAECHPLALAASLLARGVGFFCTTFVAAE